jgi:hypothetical protein
VILIAEFLFTIDVKNSPLFCWDGPEDRVFPQHAADPGAILSGSTSNGGHCIRGQRRCGSILMGGLWPHLRS